MTRASIFKNGSNQAVRLPRGMELEGVSEVELTHQGDGILITPVRKNWTSFAMVDAADDSFLADRAAIMDTERVEL